MTFPNDPRVGSKFGAAMAQQVAMAGEDAIVIETGTWEGTGSTVYLANALAEDALLFTIECDPSLYAASVDNLGGRENVVCCHGLSIPRSSLPSGIEVAAAIREVRAANKDAHIDWHPRDFVAETAWGGQDDWLGILTKTVRPSVVLLDSGAHIGWIEFQHLVSTLAVLNHKCIIGLDDTNSLKHWRSARMAEEDKRFTEIFCSNERYGSAIYAFDPLVSP